jgi:hypothetical protein
MWIQVRSCGMRNFSGWRDHDLNAVLRMGRWVSMYFSSISRLVAMYFSKTFLDFINTSNKAGIRMHKGATFCVSSSLPQLSSKPTNQCLTPHFETIKLFGEVSFASFADEPWAQMLPSSQAFINPVLPVNRPHQISERIQRHGLALFE